MTEAFLSKIKDALNRTVPITDPGYIIGEEASINEFDSWVRSSEQGLIGSVVIGQVGNGKTHFLRFVRKKHREQECIGIYIPDMFVSGPLVNALNGIYKSLFVGSENKSLREFGEVWENYVGSNRASLQQVNNEIIRYLLICNNREEIDLVLDYFSNKDLFPDEIKYLRSKFGAKKTFITNENDFAQYIGDSLEFLQLITGKKIILLFDEVDKVYSSETKSVLLSRVGLKILSAYRGLFDALNRKGLKGIITVGATPEAWQVLSSQTAFERRFKDRTIVLKVPKSKKDCFDFTLQRLDEIHYSANEEEKEVLKEMTNSLDESEVKTWADVISNLRSTREVKQVLKSVEPAELIIEVLDDAIGPLTWSEIIEESDSLKELYPNAQPTSLLNKLSKERKIRINPTRPKTYEIIRESGEGLDE